MKNFNIIAVITVFMVFCAVELILLHDNAMVSWSISSIIDKSQLYASNEHLLVLALLPIYIGIVIFGSASVGILIGSKIKQFWLKFRKNKTIAPTKNQRKK